VLDANPNLAAIALTDAGAPTLALTAAQAARDATALGEIANANYVVSVIGSALGAPGAASFFGAGGVATISSGAVTLANGASATVIGSNNTIAMNANGTVVAQGDDNIYLFGAGGGHGEIGAGDGANTGTVDFAPGIAASDLWFEQQGDTLQIDVMGTTDSLTIDDWFGGANGAAAQNFVTADGSKLDSQVGQLVSAMAAYSAANSGFNPTLASQIPPDPAMQGAVAAAWRH